MRTLVRAEPPRWSALPWLVPLLAASLSAGCSCARPTGSGAPPPTARGPAPSRDAAAPRPDAGAAPAVPTEAAVAVPPAAGSTHRDGGAQGPRPIDLAAATAILMLEPGAAADFGCDAAPLEADQIRCLLHRRFTADRAAATLVVQLYDRTGSVVGLEPARTMDGGWRGTLELVPELPVGRYRRHLAWIAAACDDFDQFFGALDQQGGRPLGYRYGPLAFQFFRSVGRTTPSAYADGWTISYNVSGSLHASADAVRETLFHEIFHLNDAAHGNWSARVLPALVDPVVERCRLPRSERLDSRCLAPFAPNHTTVRGGTFYAFQPGNGVWEYAAELAVRYYREHRALFGLAGAVPERRPFKCGPAPNPTTWKLLVDEFFGGLDRVPPC